MSDATDAPLMLSVSGARGIVGRSMTPDTAARFAAAFGSHLREREDRPLVVVGRDSRRSGAMLSRAAVAGLLGAGCDVIDVGIAATPTVGVMIAHKQAAGGLVLTASHNPAEWNGLKCLNADGVAPPTHEAECIINRFRRDDLEYALIDDLGVMKEDGTAHDDHVNRVLEHVDVKVIQEAAFRVVLDSVNGAGALAGLRLLEALGCDVIHLNDEPHGAFAHPPEPLRENLGALMEAVADQSAAVGFAQDPDADRLAIVDETGRYIGEEYTLVLAAKRVLDVHGSGVLAANLSTSRMIDDLAARYDGSRVVRAAVGEANVVEAMQREDAIIGGEGNGGVIFPAVCWVRDSISSMALVLDLMAAASAPRALSAIVDDLPRYVMVKRKFDLAALGGRDAVGPMLDRVKSRFADERIDTIDGVRIDFDEGWVHLRPSNTEPIVRLIAEARNDAAVEQLIANVARTAGV